MRSYRLIRALVLLAAMSSLGLSARAATACNAEVRATPRADQTSDEAITKVFAVEVDTKEACAKVYVDVIVTERLFSGEEIKSTRRGWRKVENHTSTYKVNYKIARDSKLVDTKFQVARCVVCGTE